MKKEFFETINTCSHRFDLEERGIVIVVNTTPHPLTFQDVNGDLVSIPCDPSLLVNAKALTEECSPFTVHTTFKGTDEGKEIIDTIKFFLSDSCDYLAIVGSMIAVNAYPGEVVGMVPVPGYERVAPAEKRMRCDCFTVA